MRSLLIALLVAGCSGEATALPVADSQTPSDTDVTESAPLDSASPDSGPVDSSTVDAPPDSTTTTLPSCLGDSLPLILGANLPFIEVAVGASKSRGNFLLDLGTTSSTIDLAAFSPAPAASGCDPTKLGQSCSFSDFDFFGSWGKVFLYTANHSGLIGGVREAGIIGTDFLSVNAYTLDYPGKRAFRARRGELCTDAQLTAAGFASLSTEGFYANDLSTLKPLSTVIAGAAAGVRVPNVPTIPVRIASVDAVAQLDTGFADSLVPYSINVNVGYYDAIVAKSPTALVRASSKDLSLTTCVSGVSEKVEAYTLETGGSLQLMAGVDVARAFPKAVVFVKRTPASAKSCGGIGTWTAPAAQMAASFFVELGVIVFDPFRGRVLVR